MTKKQAIRAAIFILLFLVMLQSVTYIIRTNGDIKDIFTGFYAEKENTLDAILIGSSPVYTYYAAPQIWGETGTTSGSGNTTDEGSGKDAVSGGLRV